MAYTLVGRTKGTGLKYKRISPYIFEKKKDFGSLKELKKANPNIDLKLVKA